MIIDPKEVTTSQFHAYMLGAVAPRPIALVSTIDKKGYVNLSPFSFFNCFSAQPPIMVFSPARRVRDQTTKHTLENVMDHAEAVIHIVNHALVEQMSLTSTEYDKGVNEFEKAGLTQINSERVKPPRVGEAPVAFECHVIEVKHLGLKGGAGSLVICEVLLAHINETILDEQKKIDPFKLDAVGRMGGNWYCRAQGKSLFEIPKPLATKGVGVDAMPKYIRESNVLTGNHLGRLGNVEQIPTKEDIENFSHRNDVQKALANNTLHQLAVKMLERGETHNAWKVLLQ